MFLSSIPADGVTFTLLGAYTQVDNDNLNAGKPTGHGIGTVPISADDTFLKIKAVRAGPGQKAGR